MATPTKCCRPCVRSKGTAALNELFFDISPVISEKLGVFPGDTPFSREWSLDFTKGHHLRLSSVRTTLHLGAHADGPNHYAAQGVGIGERALAPYMGKCLVVEAKGLRPGARVTRENFDERWSETASWPAPRILVRTGSFPDPNRWNSDFNSLDPWLIEEWARAGVRLIGIDTPSIDPEDSKDLPAHQTVARHDLAILEGLVLHHVPEGLYTLFALPLKIQGADASPVRAVLFRNAEMLGI